MNRTTGNFLIDGLADDERRRLAPHFEDAELPLGAEIAPQASVYFPTSGCVSILMLLENGESTEIALVGAEGLLGLHTVLGGEIPTAISRVQAEGRAIRLPARLATAEFHLGGPFQRRLLQYSQALFLQTAQTALCNRHHTLEQQLCRWLLLSLDRVESDQLSMTQGLIADMLGVRRAGVSVAASRLQQEGIIQYSRGNIVVLDRPAMERKSCECYAIVRSGYRAYHDAVNR